MMGSLAASEDPSKRGSFDLKSPSSVAVPQRFLFPEEKGVGETRPFSPFLEFYLSGVPRLGCGGRGRGHNTGRGEIRQDAERSSSVTAAKFRPQSLKESLVSQQPTAAVQPFRIYSLVPTPATPQRSKVGPRHAKEGPRMDRRRNGTKRQMRKRATPRVGPLGGTDKAIVSFYDEKTLREICAAPSENPSLLHSGWLHRALTRPPCFFIVPSETPMCIAASFDGQRNTTIIRNGCPQGAARKYEKIYE